MSRREWSQVLLLLWCSTGVFILCLKIQRCLQVEHSSEYLSRNNDRAIGFRFLVSARDLTFYEDLPWTNMSFTEWTFRHIFTGVKEKKV